ncbi:metallopeptidase [Candidatus Gottesmanbacteria bacterium]|nr:metallopeptidase [Candidatus Gottesmanbacteria bacterium]
MEVTPAPDVTNIMHQILKRTPFEYVKGDQITCMRSTGATSRAYARIWSFPKIWQKALSHEPHYIIEVLAHHFDKLAEDDKIRTIIHELMHIPKNFSGALVPHHGRYHRIDKRTVEKLFQTYCLNSKSEYRNPKQMGIHPMNKIRNVFGL